jgi:hypothetical protein
MESVHTSSQRTAVSQGQGQLLAYQEVLPPQRHKSIYAPQDYQLPNLENLGKS